MRKKKNSSWQPAFRREPRTFSCSFFLYQFWGTVLQVLHDPGFWILCAGAQDTIFGNSGRLPECLGWVVQNLSFKELKGKSPDEKVRYFSSGSRPAARSLARKRTSSSCARRKPSVAPCTYAASACSAS